MKNRNLRIAVYVLAVFNLLVPALLYRKLPAQIPLNWDLDGSVGYGAKYQIFLMSGMGLLFAVLFDILPKIDPRRKNYQKFSSYYDGFCVFMELFLMIMTDVVLLEAFRPGTVSVPMITMLCVGVLFLFIGNMLPKVKSNFYMGIKTPWSLSSEEVWRKTHRLGGRCFFLAGLVMLLTAFLPWQKAAFWCTFACIAIACLIPTLMSYIWWRREQEET